jgi:hypothetical protein
MPNVSAEAASSFAERMKAIFKSPSLNVKGAASAPVSEGTSRPRPFRHAFAEGENGFVVGGDCFVAAVREESRRIPANA